MNAIIIDQAATDLVEEITNISDNTDDIRAAVRRMEESLSIVLTMCADIQNTIHATTDSDTTERPTTWAGTP